MEAYGLRVRYLTLRALPILITTEQLNFLEGRKYDDVLMFGFFWDTKDHLFSLMIVSISFLFLTEILIFLVEETCASNQPTSYTQWLQNALKDVGRKPSLPLALAQGSQTLSDLICWTF